MILWIYRLAPAGDPETVVTYRCHLAEQPLGRPGTTDRYTVRLFREQGADARLVEEESFPAPNKLEAAVAYRQAIDLAYGWYEQVSGSKPGESPAPAIGSYSIN